MTDKCRKLFDSTKTNPFALSHCRLISSIDELEALPKPWCVLASNTALETSLSQDAFMQHAQEPRNLLLLTSRAAEWSVAGQLFDPDQPNALRKRLPSSLSIARRRRVPLEGDELRRHREVQRIQREQKRLEEASRHAAEDEDEDEDDDMMMAGLATAGPSSIESAAARARRLQQQLRGPSFPLFPYSEPKRSFDIFGEVLSADEVRVITGQQQNASALLPSAATSARASAAAAAAAIAAATAAAAQSNSMSDGPGASMDGPSQVPHKIVVETVHLPLRCGVVYLDLEGRSDGRSLRTTIKDLQPRKLVLLSGTPAAKKALKDHCMSAGVCGEVLTPASNESVAVAAAESGAGLFRVSIKESFLNSLHFVSAGADPSAGIASGAPGSDVQVAYAEGAVALLFQQGANLPVLTHVSEVADAHAKKGVAAAHPAIFLGNLQPLELQQQLLAGGVQCELVSGVCVCSGGLVNVRKLSPTQIRIEGALSEDYFRIRDILYQQYEIV
jgi:cleavage and polyadenylation specificity factor subunit 2